MWLTLFALTTLTFNQLAERQDLRVAHGVLAFLVLIIGASWHVGRSLSIVMVVLGYLAVDWFFVPPRFALGAASDLDWIVMFGFAATGLLISELFTKQQRAVRLAEDRAREVERLSQERMQLEREVSTARVLREADRLKNALLNSIAHDLRSPVATLSLLADPAAGFAREVALQRVADEAQRLGEFIGTLQRFATEGGGSVLQTEHHAVDALVQTAVRSSEALLAGRQVLVQLSGVSLQVSCDLTLAVQSLGNLLQNAARYSPVSEAIDVFSRATASGVEIVVADRGPGMAAGEGERIFAPLGGRSRADVNEGASGERLGMGLAIARTFARAQRGDVRYRPRDGGGSEFVLLLPL